MATPFFIRLQIKNQDELHFYGFICDRTKTLEFDSVEERHTYVDLLLKNNSVIHYLQFKHLLSWFITQLNINNELIDGTKIAGQGYKGDSIRNNYNEWRNYDTFTLDCSLQCGYASTYPRSNYIHKTDTWINIRPYFNKDNKEVVSLKIDIDEISKGKLDNDKIIKILAKEFYINDLDLNNTNEPNDKLKELFDDFIIVINEYSSENQNLVNTFDFKQSTVNFNQNLIVYGTPGCGKSYYVEHTLLKDISQDKVIRTTFFQDYTNTDFVGQILPVIEKNADGSDKVTYKFNPGPFALALEQAIKTPNEKVALVIEELNRGNAASIFGDIFQLLDREKEGSDKGVSVYSIFNRNIIDYLNDQFKDKYKFEYIKLPSNLSIFASMNTCDQNVFTLDSAFKRRWDYKKLQNKFKEDHKFKDLYIPGADITWKQLVEYINNFILTHSDGFNSEDKQIGVYFVDETGMTEEILDISEKQKPENRAKIEKFAYKVMEYLWDDVAKFQRDKWFSDNINSLDKLIEGYCDKGTKVFKEEVLKKNENE